MQIKNLLLTHIALVCCVTSALSWNTTTVSAQNNANANNKPPQQVSGTILSSLIRATIIAVDQANVTGNYTVLRDLSSFNFRNSSTPADYAELFKGMRQQNVDLSETVLLDPKVIGGAQLTTDGRLSLKGFFATLPNQITFDLVFLYEVGRWRIASLGIGSQPAVDAQSPQQQVQAIDIPNSRRNDGRNSGAIAIPIKRPN